MLKLNTKTEARIAAEKDKRANLRLFDVILGREVNEGSYKEPPNRINIISPSQKNAGISDRNSEPNEKLSVSTGTTFANDTANNRRKRSTNIFFRKLLLFNEVGKDIF